MDNISKSLGKQIGRQSDRDMSRVTFSKGTVSTAKTSDSEQEGLLILYLIIFVSTYGKKNIATKIGLERHAFLIETIEYCLCFEEFAKDTREKSEDSIEAVSSFLASMKQLYVYSANRT